MTKALAVFTLCANLLGSATGCVHPDRATTKPVDQSCAARPTPPPDQRHRVNPLRGGRLIPGLAYANQSASQTLDLIVPTKGRPPYPVVVRIHGGGFQYGEAEWDEKGPAAQAILDQGYALASVDYRVSTEARFPAAGRDVKAAIRFLRARAATYGLDPSRFAAWGESAGGYFAILLGVTGDQKTIFDDASLGNARQSSAVKAVVAWYAPTDFAVMDQQQLDHPPQSCPASPYAHRPAGGTEAYWLCGSCGLPLDHAACAENLAASNLIRYVATARRLPAFRLAHGTDDCMVPWGQSQVLLDALERRGARASLTKRERFTHADPRFETTEVESALKVIRDALRR